MITEEFFSAKLGELSKVFTGMNNISRAKRCYQAVQMLPEEAFIEICNHFIDSFSMAPLPKHFQEAAQEWRKRNRHYQCDDVIEIDVIPCLDCYGTGYIFCRLSETSPETLVFCHCEFGDEAQAVRPMSIIPQWEKGRYDIVYGFIKSPFPKAWFLPPENERERGPENFKNWSKVRRWLEKIKTAEAYFKKKSAEAIASKSITY